MSSERRAPVPRSKGVDDAVLLRPGVVVPDWSLVVDDAARRALAAICDAVGMARKWSGATDVEDRVWRAVLELYPRLGRAPSAAQLAAATGLPPGAVATALGGLRARDLVVLDGGGAIVGAYPFTERPTGHRVRLRGRVLTAMCAIDALGIGAMYGTDASIESSCRQCGAAFRATTRGDGTRLGRVSPRTAVVWSGIQYADGCSATSLCTVLAFFCSDEHLAAWRGTADGGGTGFRLSIAEALQVGKAIFAPMTRTPEGGTAGVDGGPIIGHGPA